MGTMIAATLDGGEDKVRQAVWEPHVDNEEPDLCLNPTAQGPWGSLSQAGIWFELCPPRIYVEVLITS
jgi:hypothetical protein